jgi:hypothetical protein
MSAKPKTAIIYFLLLLLHVQGVSLFYFGSSAYESLREDAVSDVVLNQLPDTCCLVDHTVSISIGNETKSFGNFDLQHFLPAHLLQALSTYKSVLELWKHVDIGYSIRKIIYPYHFFW